MKVDLHIHSTMSDGAWEPDKVVEGAVKGGLDLIAIADHDTTAGVGPAREAARGTSLQLISAVELSTTWNGRELHVLGYFVDPDGPPLRTHSQRASGARLARMEEMLKRLAAQGLEVELDAVLGQVGGNEGVLGRPHLAQALVEAGHASSVDEAFDRFIGDGLPAFVPTSLLGPEEGIQLVQSAGGIPVWAHPPGDLVDPLLPHMVEAGLKGLEVYRPFSPQRQIRRLEGIARTAGLLVTGGSDWHSLERNPPLGTFHAPFQKVKPFLEAGGL